MTNQEQQEQQDHRKYAFRYLDELIFDQHQVLDLVDAAERTTLSMAEVESYVRRNPHKYLFGGCGIPVIAAAPIGRTRTQR